MNRDNSPTPACLSELTPPPNASSVNSERLPSGPSRPLGIFDGLVGDAIGVICLMGFFYGLLTFAAMFP